YGFKSADFGKIYFNPPINLIPQISGNDTSFYASVKEIHDSSIDNEIYNLRITYKFMGTENVTVPAGNFDAIHYRYFIRYIGKEPEAALMDISGDWWFARGVGLVKQSASEQMLTLTRYELP
ncbi:MAG: hypothetical protein KAR38_15635, partial [Calditrichia bacterium]|nr:hypothetical protein [Calditrichia bacterium]